MATSQPEATDLFRAWQVDRALIRVEFRLHILTATVLARVSSTSDRHVTFSTDLDYAELTLPLSPGTIFRYLDLWAVPEHERFERVIVLFYPAPNPRSADPAQRDQVVLAEVRERCTGG